MILVWFVYGLAFFVLGLVIVVYPRKGSRFDLARDIWFVGAFGIVHGLNEWLDMFIDIGRPLPPGLLAEVQMLTLGGSFFLLLQFGVAVACRNVKRGVALRAISFVPVVVWLGIVVFAGSPRRLLMGDIWARYLLCVPGAFLTAWALLSQVPRFRAKRLSSVTRNLTVAAVTFAVYGVLAGVFVKKASFFPATIVNYDSFVALTGFPVQVFRALCAMLAAWTIIRILDVFRWETQEAVRISELRCATIASAMPVFLFMTDRDTVVTFVQGKGLDVLGLRPEQIQGQPIAEVFPSGAQLAADCRRALSGEAFVTDACMNGATFELYYSALEDPAGVATNAVAVALDITAKILAQGQQDEYRRRMEKTAREAAAGILSATMARQVAEPLSVTELVLERAMADLAPSDIPDAVRNNLRKSLSEISRAHETLQRFMDVAHPGERGAEQPVGLYQIAKRTMSVFADSAQRNRLTIAIKDMDIVPLVGISPREVEQIFYHLIQRAIDAAGGEVESKLVIHCSAADGQIELVFSDTCGAMPPGQSERPFDPVLVSPQETAGAGLGLAVVKQIVTDQGGEITVATEAEGTTVFRVRLPAKRVY
jgi:signal transduction histidine kinase